MRQKRLLLLLVLLLTATTGAWAQDAKHLITATYDKQTRLLEQPLPYATTVGELYEAITGQSFSDLISSMSAVGMPLTGIGSNNTSVVSIGELNGASTLVTVNADGKATVGLNFSGYVRGSYVSVVPPLYAYMKDGVKDADKWTVKVGDGQAQALPISGLKGDGSETITLKYTGRLKVKGVKATSDAEPAAPAGKTVDLSTLTADYEAQDGDVLTGTLGANVKISIADGATVTLDGVNISGGSITCDGSVTMILMGANTVTATSEKAAIKIGGPGTTLTITGSGSLTAQGGLEAAGIGTDRNENGELSFGNIVINGGTVTATGGDEGAGIGTGLAQGQFNTTSITCGDITINGGTVTAIGGLYGAGIGTGPTMSDGGSASITCGDITINGGTVTATGGDFGPGIGTGVFLKYGGESASNRCGAITIGAGVTSVTATKGSSDSPNSIGKGYAYGGTQNYGTITIGGTIYWDGSAYQNGGNTYLATSPLIYDPAAPAAKPAATVTTAPTGAAIVGVGKSTALVSGGVADGGTLMYAVTTTNTKPASTDGFSDAVPTAQTITASGTVYVWYYVKGDDTHSDSEIAGPVSVTVTPALSLTSPVVGQVIGSDGKNYAAASVPSGVTKVAMIAYVSGSNGLAIALADEGSMNWATAKSTCEAKTPAFTGGTWKLPSQAEWNQMFKANGGDEERCYGLNTIINTAGGTALLEGGTGYWTSTSNGSNVWYVWLMDGDTDWRSGNVNLAKQVRACLAF